MTDRKSFEEALLDLIAEYINEADLDEIASALEMRLAAIDEERGGDA